MKIKKDESCHVYVGDEHIGECKPIMLEGDQADRKLGGLEYYYRRGNKIFLRNAFGKMTFLLEDAELKEWVGSVPFKSKLSAKYNLV